MMSAFVDHQVDYLLACNADFSLFWFLVVLLASPHPKSKEMEAAVQRGRLLGCSWNDQKSAAWGEL
jgi:hypothetical protein